MFKTFILQGKVAAVIRSGGLLLSCQFNITLLVMFAKKNLHLLQLSCSALLPFKHGNNGIFDVIFW